MQRITRPARGVSVASQPIGHALTARTIAAVVHTLTAWLIFPWLGKDYASLFALAACVVKT